MALGGCGLQWEKGITYRNSKVPYFIPAPPFFLLIPSDLEHLPFLSFCFKTQVFLHQKKRPLKLVPALMSIFIIVNIFRAEMGVVHTCAILEPELIMLFYKMIIVGLFGSFFFFFWWGQQLGQHHFSSSTGNWSLTSTPLSQWLVGPLLRMLNSPEQYETSNWQGWD